MDLVNVYANLTIRNEKVKRKLHFYFFLNSPPMTFWSTLINSIPTGVLQGVYWGLGTGSGTIAGGFLIHHIGAVATFRCVACCAFVVCVLFCLAQFRWTKETVESRHLDFEYTYLPSVELKDTEELLRGYRVSKNLKSKQDISRNY